MQHLWISAPSVANTRLTEMLNPLDATLTKNQGWRVAFPILKDLHGPATRTHLLTQVLSFHTLAHSFALNKNSTPSFSNVSALFAQNHPGGWAFPRVRLLLMDFVCAKPVAALRCTQFPPLGGFHATKNVAHRHTGFLRSPLRSRAADWQVCSRPGGVGGGPRVDGDQRGDRCGTEACAHRQVCCGTRQRRRQSHPGQWSVRGLLHCAEELRQGV